MTLDELLKLRQYSLSGHEKERMLVRELNRLCNWHRSQCPEYARVLSVLYPDFTEAERLIDIPYVPARIFKSHRLTSVPDQEIFKTLTSSGTTGHDLSKIYLDRKTAELQSQALANIMLHLLGPDRLPMIILDNRAALSDPKRLSARAAGVIGMMPFGRQHFYALDNDLKLDESGLLTFIQQFGKERFVIFGLTHVVWHHLIEHLRDRDISVDMSQGILIHGGGWKRLQAKSISNGEFKRNLKERTGLVNVHNFYGFVEQVGSIFLELEHDCFFAPNFAEIIVRDPKTWEEAEPGQVGVIQAVSLLPRSYPGHSILTEDMGCVLGRRDSVDGLCGQFFSVIGRVPQAELRGCSDTYEFSGIPA